MPEPIRRERKSRSGSVLASMNPRTMSLKKKKEEDNTVERIEVPYLCPIVLRKEVILQWMNSSFNYKISGWMYGKINVINSNGLSGISCLFQIQVQTSTTMKSSWLCDARIPCHYDNVCIPGRVCLWEWRARWDGKGRFSDLSHYPLLEHGLVVL